MKKLLGWFLVVALLSLGGLQAWAAEDEVLAAEVLEAGASKIVWIDVRSAEEYQSGHLAQAVNIPHTEIGEGMTTLTIEKDTEIKLYCGSGRRAGIALKTLEGMGYTRASNEGGYSELVKNKDLIDNQKR